MAKQARAAMWFGYGGPGFDPSMWPETWSDGQPMEPAQYYAATHLILSYATLNNSYYTYYNAGIVFVRYASKTFMGIDFDGSVVNENATMFQIFARADEVPDDFMCYYLNCGRKDYVQYVIAQDPYEAPTGSLEIVKTSALSSLSGSNPCYSLEGATFGVYADRACTQLAATLVTDSAGHAIASGLNERTYWVKELSAPAGYAIDSQEVTVAIQANETCTLTLADMPQADLLPLVARKVDAEAQTMGLAGAEFTVNHYAGLYDAANLPKSPTRHWVFKTDADGHAALGDEWLVSGDELYRDNNGTPVLPLGTVTVQETKAPEGYQLDNGELYVQQITASGDGEQIVACYQAPTVADATMRGGLSVQKTDAETGFASPQGNASLAGAEFAVISLNERFVVVGGQEYGPGSIVTTLVTDEDGFAQTSATLLPLGTYRLQETKAPEGYLASDATWEIHIETPGAIVAVGASANRSHAETEVQNVASVNANSPLPTVAPSQDGDIKGVMETVLGLIPQVLPLGPRLALADEPSEMSGPMVSEQVIRGGIRVYKVDADTGLGSPQGDATLESTEFSITSLNEGPVMVDGAVYSYGDVVKTIYTDADGMAQTGERDLPYGYYSVEETGAPMGYYRTTQAVMIKHDGVIVEVERYFENEVKRGGIRVQKLDAELGTAQAQGNASLAGTQFSITNASESDVVVDGTTFAPGEEVCVITTDATGIAQTGTNDLPFGTYAIAEIQAPAGYHLSDTEPRLVEIREGGTYHDASPSFSDQVMRGGISLTKHDADLDRPEPQGEATLAGAEFTIYNASSNPVLVNGERYEPGDAVATIVTDENGFAATGERDLPFGAYTVRETKASAGYACSEETQTIHVSEEGLQTPLPTTVAEQVQRGGFGLRKFDAETQLATPQGSASLAGATYEIVNASTHPVIVKGEEYAPGAIVMTVETNRDGWAQTGNHDLPFGTYEVRETNAPNGYRLGLVNELGEETGEGVSFTASVDDEWSWHSYESELFDQVVRGGISLIKVDADLGAQAQGRSTLGGAQFSIANASANDVVVGGTSFAPGSVIMTITTDETGRASTGQRDLPFGVYTVTEVAAPSGYAIDATPQTVAVTQEETVTPVAQHFANQALRGGVSLQKADSEIGSAGPQGSATYQGAVFEVSNANDQPVVVDGVSYQPNEVVATLVTDEHGYAATPANALPYGVYRIQETNAPAGYLINPEIWEVTVDVADALIAVGSNGESVPEAESQSLLDDIADLFSPTVAQAQEADSTSDNVSIPEQVIRGGLEVQKVDAEQGEAIPQGDATLAGAQFAIKTLNERDVVVRGSTFKKGDTVMTIETDETGYAATGTWDLPFGTYSVSEAKAPAGYLAPEQADAQVFEVSADGAMVGLDRPFANTPVRGGLAIQKVDAETLGTSPLGSATLDGTEFAITNASQHAVVINDMTFEPGDVITTLQTDSTGYAQTGPYDLPFGTYAVAETTAPEGYVQDTADPQYVSIIENGQIAACATPFANRVARSDIEGIKVESETQQRMAGVAFLITSLTTGERHVIVTDENGLFTTSSSAVPHSQRTNGNDAALGTDGTVANESLLSTENGIWFSGSQAITTVPDDNAGALPFDRYRFEELATSASYGHDLVSFEVSMRHDGQTVDLGTVDNNKIQLKTQASFGTPGHTELEAQADVTIVDVVSFANLTPGLSYTLEGTLMDRKTGLPLLDVQGNTIGSSLQFTPEERGGAVEMSFELDASQLAGTSVVVFERLLLNDTEVASHEDIADDGQTVTFVGLHTTAAGAVSMASEEQAKPVTTIRDNVTYKGLTVGRPYRLGGTLVDKISGQPVIDADGNPVTSNLEFVPIGRNGIVTVEFTFDASQLAGHTVVAFERLYQNELEIAAHTDLNDSGQAVHLVSLSTTATDRQSKTHSGEPSRTASVVDVVTYQGLQTGVEYQLGGTLIDRATEEPLRGSNGEPISTSLAFIPDSPNGTVTMEFFLDSSGLAGESTVVFEVLTRKGSIVATHADLDDEGQTVTWAPVSPIPQSGDARTSVGYLLPSLAGTACVAAGIALARSIRHRAINKAGR